MTPKQAEVYALIRQSDVCPSYQEMATALGMKSKSGIARLVDGMVEAGILKRRKGGSRNLYIAEKAKSAWLTIESAPKGEFEWFNAWDGDLVFPACRYEGNFVDANHDLAVPQPTHWQPLPEPPHAK